MKWWVNAYLKEEWTATAHCSTGSILTTESWKGFNDMAYIVKAFKKFKNKKNQRKFKSLQ